VIVDNEMRKVADQLMKRYGDRPRQEIDSTVDREASRFDRARVRTFVPVLVERAAKLRLRGRRGEAI
jgi:hypothetical protein